MRKGLFAVALLINVCVAQEKILADHGVCDLLRSPEKFSRTMVRVSGNVPSPRVLQLYDASCGRISIAYAENPHLKPKANFRTIRDKNFDDFTLSLGVLVPPAPERRAGPNCTPGRITVTVEGRFDSSYAVRDGKKVQVLPGFGHAGLFDYELVLHRVIAVNAIPASCVQ